MGRIYLWFLSVQKYPDFCDFRGPCFGVAYGTSYGKNIIASYSHLALCFVTRFGYVFEFLSSSVCDGVCQGAVAV